MDTSQQTSPTLLPSDPGGARAGFAASLGVHALLLAALAGVVQWRTQTPTVAAAELWSSVPEVAAAPPAPAPAPAPVPAPAPAPVPAPAPPPPPPPAVAAPKPPDIAIEQARQRAERERQELERQAAEKERERQARERQQREQQQQQERERQARERQEREREQRAAAERERQQAAATERARQEQLRRMMESAGTSGGSAAGTAARDAAPSASYVARLASLIRSNSVFTGEVSGNPAAEVEVRAAAGGTILSRRLVKSSGNAAWDDAVLRAIDRTATLPPDTNGRVPPLLIIAFRPKE